MLSVRAATTAAIVGLALVPALASAQAPPAEPAAAPSTVNLPPVVVTAGRGSDLEKLDVSTTMLTRKEVEAMPEGGVDQIINRIPSIWTYTIPSGQLHPTGQPVSIRGFGSSTTINTLVMMDGVPINDPYFRTVDWTQVSKNNIERIEVIRGGGATSLWGNMAMGGVINIVTRRPTKTGAQADLSFGMYNTANANVGASGIVNDKLSVGVNYNHFQSSGYNTTPSQYQNANLVPTFNKSDNLDASMYFDNQENLKLFAKAYFHQAFEDGLTWSLSHNNWSNYRLLLGGSYSLDDKQSVAFSFWGAGGTFGTVNTASGSYTLNNTAFLNQFVSQIETSPYSDFGGAVFYQLEAGSLRDVKIGVDARRMTIMDTNNLFASSTAAPTVFIANGENRLQGVFGQGTYKFGFIPLDVTVGLRGDFWQALNASVITQNSATTNFIPNASAASFDPRVGIKFYASDEVSVRAAIYRNFSAPGMNQMYRSFASGTSYTAINPNLLPMTNFGQEVGLDFSWKGFSLSGTYFNNNMDNYIDFVTVCNANAACARPFVTAAGLSPTFTTVNQYNNVGNATFQGFELIGNWQAMPELKLTAGFTTTTAYLTSSNYPSLIRTGVQLGQVPRWTVTAGAEWRPLPDLLFSATLRSFPAYWNDTQHTQLNDAATILDIGASWSPVKDVDLYMTAQNLTNFQYLARGYTTTSFEGTTVNATAIPALGMPLTVIGGVRARF